MTTQPAAATSTVQAALPYAGPALGAAVLGSGIAFLASTSVIAVIGFATAFFGAYAFYGIVTCGIAYANDPVQFQENVNKYMVIAAGVALADFARTVAQIVATELSKSACSKR